VTIGSEPVEPERVVRCRRRAQQAGFPLSCEAGIGALLATLAAAVPEQGRILELGTGGGVGLAWIAEGLSGRDDVEVVSVELAPEMAELARAEAWPPRFRLLLGDGAIEVRRHGSFDLIFADAPGGKLEGLDDTSRALSSGAILLVDDMDLDLHDGDGLRDAISGIRDQLLSHPDLVSSSLDYSSGAILSTRRVSSV
jgi:demethylmenaquinone methyltransferase/2-methoxy-6-polyprenyl-1,4-benzoquinol methylase